MRKAEALLDELDAIPENEYRSYQETARKKILDYHLQYNSFYKNFFGKNSFSSWETVPVMNKTHLQQPLKKRLSQGFNKNNSYVGKTSGSSGQPFIFAKDRLSHALSWANFSRKYDWFGINLNKSLQARFYGIPLDFYGNMQEKIKDRLGQRRRFSIFDLSNEKLAVFLTRFTQAPFEYINGYTSAILLFSKYLKEREICLKEVCPSLRYCIVTSESLFKEDKTIIEKALGVPVINEYGASEVGLIAFENPENQWRVNAEDLFVEILDEENQPLPYGQEGRVVITSLYNKAHPVIRYEIGDFGSLSKNSSFKFPKLQKLSGRTSDIAYLANGKVVPGLSFYYVTKSIIAEHSSVKEFVVRQTSADAFHIDYVGDSFFTLKEKRAIFKAIEKYVGKDLQISLERQKTLKRTKSGKLKQFTSLLT